jgi:nicotinamide/nicotinate riboside kinase
VVVTGLAPYSLKGSKFRYYRKVLKFWNKMIIGIAGVSRSGKTSLAFLIKRIMEERGETAVVLSQDDFVFDESEIPKIRHRTDWECPESIDFQKYKQAIVDKQAVYQHVITEGLLNFWDAETDALFDRRLFIIVDKHTFFNRRLQEKRWGFEPKWFIEHVWKSYLKYGQKILIQPKNGVLLLSGNEVFDVDLITKFLGI